MQPKLVIFDMDGTMLDTEPISMKGWHDAAQEMGFEVSMEEFRKVFMKMIGTNAVNCKAVMHGFFGDGFDMDRGHELCLAYMDRYFAEYGVPVKPGLVALLDKLDEQSIKKCVATSTGKERATHKLTMAGLAHRFEVIVGGDCVERSKPNPDIFLKAAADCGIAPADCVVIEDSLAGTEGGFRAGMRVVHVPDLLPPSEEVRGMAWVVCSDLFEVADVFTNYPN